MNKKKELYLHIGMPKTATTVLQKFILSKYEDYIGKYNSKDKGKTQNKLLYDIINKNKDCYFYSSNRLILSEETFLFNEPHRIFSKENYLKVIDFFRSKGYNINILVFIRKQDDLAKSLYLQSVRHGNSLYLREHYTNLINNTNKKINYLDRKEYLPLKKTFTYSYFLDFINQNSDSLMVIPYESIKKSIYKYKKTNISYGYYRWVIERLLNNYFKNAYHNNRWIKGFIPYFSNHKIKFSRFNKMLAYLGLIDFWDKLINIFDKPYKDKTGTCKKILEMCKEDNLKINKKYNLNLEKYGYIIKGDKK